MTVPGVALSPLARRSSAQSLSLRIELHADIADPGRPIATAYTGARRGQKSERATKFVAHTGIQNNGIAIKCGRRRPESQSLPQTASSPAPQDHAAEPLILGRSPGAQRSADLVVHFQIGETSVKFQRK